MNRDNRAASRHEAIAWPISERPPGILRFLPGSPFEPPRAGMTPKTNGDAFTSDPHPAALRGRPPGRLDDLHRLEPVPAVAARHGLVANARQEVARLVHVHVVELTGEGVDLPAVRLRVEDTHLVLEAPPLEHAGLSQDLDVTVDVPREEVHMEVPNGAGREPDGEVGEVIGRDLEPWDPFHNGAHLDDVAEEPAHVVNRVA